MKDRRIQLKFFICILGILLLLILIGVENGKKNDQNNKDTVQPPKNESVDRYIREPEIEIMLNAWILEQNEEGLLMFDEDGKRQFPFSKELLSSIDQTVKYREQMADIIVTDGCITDVFVKKTKVNDRVLAASEDYIELEKLGVIAVKPNCKGYQICDELKVCNIEDIPIGYDFTDFVIEEEEICGFLIVRKETMEDIRVLLKNSDFSGLYHEELIISSDNEFEIIYGAYDDRFSEIYSADEKLYIQAESNYLKAEDGKYYDRALIRPKVLSGKLFIENLKRDQKNPSYRGTLEIVKTPEGIIVVNELPLEEYLYSVVPSEMPAMYPKEALKAQSICARTYAYGKMMHAGYPQYGAHVDDSTSYQVYNNIPEQEATSTAVKETYGELLYTAGDILAETYFYSTSCGVGSNASIWKTKKTLNLDYLQSSFLNYDQIEKRLNQESEALKEPEMEEEEDFATFIYETNPKDLEVNEPWYRWDYKVEDIRVENLIDRLSNRYEIRKDLVLTKRGKAFESLPIKEFTKIYDIHIERRGPGGVADELIIETDVRTYKVISEHNIRYVLNNGESKVLRQDGSKIQSNSILPSGFFCIEISKEKEEVSGYSIHGGGYGHGVGMSQNGAKELAKAGYDSEQILQIFYHDCKIYKIYD